MLLNCDIDVQFRWRAMERERDSPPEKSLDPFCPGVPGCMPARQNSAPRWHLAGDASAP